MPSRLGTGSARLFSTQSCLRKEIRDAYILSAARTPTAKFNGSYTSVPAPQLGAVAIKSAVEKSGVPVSKITDVYMGNVLQGSVGQAPARQAAIFAGLPPTVEAITVNKVCASGLKAVAFAAQNIQLGLSDVQVAGGMENMTRVPYYMPRASGMPAFGHIKLEDGLIKDGLTDVYYQFHMGNCAENTAKKYGVTREMQDKYAIESYQRAQAAWKAKAFADEIAPVTVTGKKGDTIIDTDEGYLDIKLEKVPTLKPAFVRDGTGTVTAANSSTLNDGASALVLGSKDIAREFGSKSRVLARICGSADAAVDPIDFPIAPAKAVPIALERAGITKEQVAHWEFNEAFAAVIKANEQILGLEGANVNPLGGAIALGHALGSSGSRILVTLLHQLKPGEYGVAAICNGGGAATAMVVQRIESVTSETCASTMSLVVEFLSGIRRFVLAQNGDELRAWLLVENNVPDHYYRLQAELKASFPDNGSDALEKLVDKCLPEEDNVSDVKGSPWPGFNSLMKVYLEYWRDVDFSNLASHLADTPSRSCANALANPTYGAMLLQTSLSFSDSLSKLVMGLTRKPELIAQIQGSTSGDESGEKKSIVELAADVIQKIFTSCLTDRSSTRWSPPKGKKVAVYLFANLTLKLLFACDKSRLAVQLFTNLSTSGPALSLYPASQRVTFLYYLGRFNFDYGHYFRAHMCFEAAYKQCPPRFQKHRRQILTFWIPSNLLLGRFPSLNLLGRPEAVGFREIFFPICAAVRTGNFVAFYQALAQSREWLWDRGLYLTLLSRLKPLVWRSFSRRVFFLTFQNENADGTPSKKMAALSIDHLVTAASYVQKLLEGYVPLKPAPRARPAHISTMFMKAVTNSVSDAESNSLLAPPPGGPRHLMPTEGLIFGNKKPDHDNIESILAGLIYAGLLNGFIARNLGVFAVEGARKTGNPVAAGWPNAYQSIKERFTEEYEDAVAAYNSGESADPPGELDDVPGWVQKMG
ncbi:cop9 signalosome complex subunit 12 [Podospora aff. communis PSN243]|uniref:acetyl-CoA C-acetyltransferase n=1 Tax=Podospora aff. communis PSN243 TaxID=3040156 RepID=A0AAV9GMJ7_9PEZI|nr:cop9 signalosome complex subunit 12 [Podospora aff. communis PSN243]